MGIKVSFTTVSFIGTTDTYEHEFKEIFNTVALHTICLFECTIFNKTYFNRPQVNLSSIQYALSMGLTKDLISKSTISKPHKCTVISGLQLY